MRNAPLEPGLLRLFRLFLFVQLILIYVNVMAHSARGILDGCPWCAVVFGSVSIALLLAYLSIPWLQRKLGAAYLPIALIGTATISLIAQDLLLNSRLSLMEGGSEESAWQIFLFLFIPMVLVSWQYSFRAVVVYCLFTAFLDFLLVRLNNPDFYLVHQTYNRLIFIRTLSFLIAGAIISRIVVQMRRQQAALQLANQKLAHYAVTLEQLTLSRERNRLARELHDTLAHTLSGLAVQLEGMKSLWSSDPQRAYVMLENSLSATRDGLTETRHAIHALRSAPLEALGFELALRELAHSAAERGGFECRFEDGFENQDRTHELSEIAEQCLYRAAQETLDNVIRHAQASQVNLRLESKADFTILTIQDDGVGFDPDQDIAEGHFGLRGMCERAELAGGRINIESQPGLGATVRIEVPNDD
jgi:signal transduction histidine kinase